MASIKIVCKELQLLEDTEFRLEHPKTPLIKCRYKKGLLDDYRQQLSIYSNVKFSFT